MTQPEPAPEAWEILKQLGVRTLAPKVLYALADGPRRYSEIFRAVTLLKGEAIYSQTLSHNLDWLCEQGFVTHNQQQPIPDYALTDDGHLLLQCLTNYERDFPRRRPPDSQPP